MSRPISISRWTRDTIKSSSFKIHSVAISLWWTSPLHQQKRRQYGRLRYLRIFRPVINVQSPRRRYAVWSICLVSTTHANVRYERPRFIARSRLSLSNHSFIHLLFQKKKEREIGKWKEAQMYPYRLRLIISKKRQIVFAVGHSSIVLFQQLPLPVNYPYCANDNRFITSYVWSVIGRWISVN